MSFYSVRFYKIRLTIFTLYSLCFSGKFFPRADRSWKEYKNVNN